MKFPSIDDRRQLLHKAQAPFPGAGMLALRLVVGVTFMVHGIDKLADLNGTEQFFASLGIPAPAVMAPFVALTEAVGGALLIAGLATPLAAAALAINMIVALATAHPDGVEFFVADGGIELELLLAGACTAIGLTGPGRLSVDAALADLANPTKLEGASR